jgi:hypothetical protein
VAVYRHLPARRGWTEHEPVGGTEMIASLGGSSIKAACRAGH